MARNFYFEGGRCFWPDTVVMQPCSASQIFILSPCAARAAAFGTDARVIGQEVASELRSIGLPPLNVMHSRQSTVGRVMGLSRLCSGGRRVSAVVRLVCCAQQVPCGGDGQAISGGWGQRTSPASAPLQTHGKTLGGGSKKQRTYARKTRERKKRQVEQTLEREERGFVQRVLRRRRLQHAHFGSDSHASERHTEPASHEDLALPRTKWPGASPSLPFHSVKTHMPLAQ